MRPFLILFLFTLAVVSPAQTPLSTIVTGPGEYNLEPGTAYLSMVTISGNVTINGNNAVLITNNDPINLSANSSLTLNNVRLVDGTQGIFSEAGNTILTLNNVTFEGLTFRGIRLANGVLNGTNISFNNVTTAVSLTGGSVNIDGFNVTGSDAVGSFSGFDTLSVMNMSTTSTPDAVDITDSAGSVSISNYTYTGAGQDDGLFLRNIQSVELDDMIVTNVNKGIILDNCDTVELNGISNLSNLREFGLDVTNGSALEIAGELRVDMTSATQPLSASIILFGGASLVTNSTTFFTGGRYGIRSEGPGNSIDVNGGTFTNNFDGISIFDGVLNVDSATMTGAGQFCIIAGRLNNRCTISNSTFRNTNNRGLQIESVDSPSGDDLVIDNCTFDDLGPVPLLIGNNVNATQFVTVRNSEFSGSIEQDIVGTNINRIQIQNCEFTGNGNDGSIIGSISDLRIANSSFQNYRDAIRFTGNLNFTNSTISNSQVGITGVDLNEVLIDGYTSTNNVFALNLQGNSGDGSRVIRNSSATANSSLPRSARETGYVIVGTGEILLENVTIANHSIGLSIKETPGTLRNCQFTNNFAPAIVGENNLPLRIEESNFTGAERLNTDQPGGSRNVDNFDLIFTTDSDVQISDSTFLDAADNAINLQATGARNTVNVIERCVIIGSFTHAINPDEPPGSNNAIRQTVIRDVTALNSTLSDIRTAANEFGVAHNVIAGSTGRRVISRYHVFEDTAAFDINSTAFNLRHSAMVWSQGSGVQVSNLRETAGVQKSIVENNAIFMVTEEDADIPTLRGVFNRDQIRKADLIRNYIAGGGGERWSVQNGTALFDVMRYNHLGYPGGRGYLRTGDINPGVQIAPQNFWGDSTGPFPHGEGAEESGDILAIPALVNEPMMALNTFFDADANYDQTIRPAGERDASIRLRGSLQGSADIEAAVFAASRYFVDPMDGNLPSYYDEEQIAGWWDIWVDERIFHNANGPVNLELFVPEELVAGGGMEVFLWDEEKDVWTRPANYTRSQDSRLHSLSFTETQRPRTMALATGAPSNDSTSSALDILVELMELSGGGQNALIGSDDTLDAADIIRLESE